MMPYSSEPNPTIESNAPNGSSGISCCSFDDGHTIVTITKATTAITTDTKKTEPNQK